MADHLFSQATKTLKSLAIKIKEPNQFGRAPPLSVMPEISSDGLIFFFEVGQKVNGSIQPTDMKGQNNCLCVIL